MRSVIFTVLSVGLVATALQSSQPSMGAPRGANIVLTATIIREVSCTRGDLTLHLKLTFRNVGSETIILDRRSSVIARDMVSSSVEAAARKEYEYVGRYEDSGPDRSGENAMDADPKNFVSLAPGESFETESDWSRTYLTVADGSHKAPGGLSYGQHFLQVDVGTWLYSENLALKVRKVFAGKGVLWTRAVTSSPMPFKVDQDRAISICK